MSEELEKLRLECERAWSEVDEVARERDVLRAELAMEQRLSFRKQLHANADRDEALMRQALEQMESNKYALAVASPTDDIKAYEAAIAALRERLGEEMTEPITFFDVLRRLEEIERARGIKPTPTPPLLPPQVPLTTATCSRCGLKLDGVMGYVCPQIDCPTFLNARC